jgi:hypothetical protein
VAVVTGAVVSAANTAEDLVVMVASAVVTASSLAVTASWVDMDIPDMDIRVMPTAITIHRVITMAIAIW